MKLMKILIRLQIIWMYNFKLLIIRKMVILMMILEIYFKMQYLVLIKINNLI